MKTNVDYANNGNVRMDVGYHFKNKANSNNLYFLIVVCFALFVVFTGCKKEEDKTPRIVMTTAASDVSIFLKGSGDIIIDWGDGESDTCTLTTWFGIYCRHSYSGSSEHTIKMTGNYTISTMYCFNNQLTSLDVSKNVTLEILNCEDNQLKKLNVSGCTALKLLHCEYNKLTSLDVSKNTVLVQLSCSHNQLTSLDVSRNTELWYLSCHNNQLNANALNTLFETLHSNAGWKFIYIGNNSGTYACDRNIATKKGWTVKD